MKVKKKVKTRNRQNQEPHLTLNTLWKHDKNTQKHHIKESQEVSIFIADDHKAARKSQNRLGTGTVKNHKRA